MRFLLATILTATLMAPAQAHPSSEAKARCHRHGTGRKAVKSTIRCFARRYEVSVPEALAVAKCESRYYARARSGKHKGVYQFSAWRKWSRSYLGRVRPWYKPRYNVKVAMMAVAKGGWGPWSCA